MATRDDRQQPNPSRNSASEREIIHRLTRHSPPAGAYVVVGIGDDAAVVRLTGNTVLTTDAFVEGTHFRPGWMSTADVGYKAVVCALSDVYAMGGEPIGATVAVMAPTGAASAVFDDLGLGIGDALTEHGVDLLGGDVTRGPVLAVTVSVVGHLSGTPLLLNAARVGDAVIVTGSLGAPACALAILSRMADGESVSTIAQPELEFVKAFSRPVVDPVAARRLRNAGAEAATDISDGLVVDACGMAAASGFDIIINRQLVPVDAGAGEWLAKYHPKVDPVEWAVASGEEYRLLATLPPSRGLSHTLNQNGWSQIGTVRTAADSDIPTVRWADTASVIDPSSFAHIAQPFTHFP